MTSGPPTSTFSVRSTNASFDSASLSDQEDDDNQSTTSHSTWASTSDATILGFADGFVGRGGIELLDWRMSRIGGEPVRRLTAPLFCSAEAFSFLIFLQTEIFPAHSRSLLFPLHHLNLRPSAYHAPSPCLSSRKFTAPSPDPTLRGWFTISVARGNPVEERRGACDAGERTFRGPRKSKRRKRKQRKPQCPRRKRRSN